MFIIPYLHISEHNIICLCTLFPFRSDKQAAVFCHYVAEAERMETKKVLELAHFVSILCDGATDVSSKEQEITYIRTACKGIFAKILYA